MEYCSNCGEKLAAEAKFCGSCGTKVMKDEKKVETKEEVNKEKTIETTTQQPKGSKKKIGMIVGAVLVLALIGFGLKASGMFTPKMEKYAGVYMKKRSGSMPGDHTESYNEVPLDSVEDESYIELTEDGVYKKGFIQRFNDTRELYAKRLGVTDYAIDDNEIKRNRSLNPDEIKEYVRLYLDSDGKRIANKSRYEKYMNAGSEYVEEKNDNYGRYELYDITNWYIKENENDLADHMEYDFINEDGELVSINYYSDEDKTSISIYSKE